MLENVFKAIVAVVIMLFIAAAVVAPVMFMWAGTLAMLKYAGVWP